MCVIPCNSHLCVCASPQRGSLLSQLCLPVRAVVGALLGLVQIRNHKIFLSERLQLGPPVSQSSVDSIPLLLLQLATEQDETRDANDEGDGAQAEGQTQVCHPRVDDWKGRLMLGKKMTSNRQPERAQVRWECQQHLYAVVL